MDPIQPKPAERRLTSPRAAGIAGILFAVLYGASQVLIRLSLPDSITDQLVWSARESRSVVIALSLVPFAGLAFLWFIGVVRDRIGKHEDQLFATVFLGSGLLYLGMIFVTTGLAGGLIAFLKIAPKVAIDPIYIYSRLVMSQIMNVFALRMAAIFMTSFAAIFTRTGLMPRWVAILTILLAILLMLSVSLSVWLSFAFPIWVFVISLFILISNYRRQAHLDAGLTAE